MTTDEYQRACLRTESKIGSMFISPEDAPTKTVNSRILHGIMGLSTESGELMDILKKHLFYNKLLSTADIFDEIGDCCWYLAVLSAAIGYPLSEVMEANIRKLKARYPERFTEEAALNRDLDSERIALEDRSGGT